jgi:hypothetical protein
MSKTLVIAEKPSVAQDIVRALTPSAGKFEKHDDHFENDRYVVTSAVGKRPKSLMSSAANGALPTCRSSRRIST